MKTLFSCLTLLLYGLFWGTVLGGTSAVVWYLGYPRIALGLLVGFGVGFFLYRLALRRFPYRALTRLFRGRPELASILPLVREHRFREAISRLKGLPSGTDDVEDAVALCRAYDLRRRRRIDFDTELSRFILFHEHPPLAVNFAQRAAEVDIERLEAEFALRERLIAKCLEWLDSEEFLVREGAGQLFKEIVGRPTLKETPCHPLLGSEDVALLFGLKLLLLGAYDEAVTFLKRDDLDEAGRERKALLELAELRARIASLANRPLSRLMVRRHEEVVLFFLIDKAALDIGNNLVDDHAERYEELCEILERKRQFVDRSIQLLCTYPEHLLWVCDPLLSELTGQKQFTVRSADRWADWWKEERGHWGDTALQILEANRLYDLDEPSQAVGVYREVLRKEPRNLIARTNLGLALLKAEKTDEARDTFQRILRREPTSVGARFHLGRLEWQSENLTRAVQHFEAILAQDKSHAPALWWMGRIAADRGKLSTAESFFKQAVAADPEDSDCLLGLLFILVQTDRIDEARSLLRRRAPHLAGANLSALLYKVHKEGGDEEKAQELAERLIDDPPDDLELLEELWVDLEEGGDYERAMRIRQRIIELRAERGEL